MQNHDASESMPDWLRLPPRRPFRAPGPSAKYGASHVAAQYCGLNNQRFSPDSKDAFVWLHGWRPDHATTIDPIYTAAVSLDPGPSTILVGRQLEADFLSSHGYSNTRAIGMPICYTENPPVSRRPGSLLVVPVHSLETTNHVWPFEQYANLIVDAAKDFDDVVVCLHPACIKNGYWIKEFESLNLPWVSGAEVNDANSLDRMRYLCSQFEYVTTNGLTSTIAYASADAAKVSIFGPFCELQISDVEEVQFYQQNPGLAQRVFPHLNEDAVRKHLENFFCHPASATDSSDWGREQLGYDALLPPDELAELLFGPPPGPRSAESRPSEPGFWRKSATAIRANMRHKQGAPELDAPAHPGGANCEQKTALEIARKAEQQRIQELPPDQPGTVSIDDQQFHFADAQSFLKEYAHVFENENLFFPSIYADPRIVHIGAKSGLAERYWLSRHPEARIVSYPTEATYHSLLKQNLADFESTHVIIHDANTWPDLENLDDGDIEFLVADVCNDDIEQFVNARSVLARTKRLCINWLSHTDQTQRLSDIIIALEQSGFRYHIVPAPQSSSPRPLVRLKALDGIDSRLVVWGYRGDRFPKTLSRSSQ